MRRIVITVDDNGNIDVEENGKTCDGLGWDEMLGQIAAMTIPLGCADKQGIFSMRTPEQWETWKKNAFQRSKGVEAA